MKKQLREYQKQNAKEATEILKKYGLVYLQHEMRTGKSLTALQICQNVKVNKVLFLTKKKAIGSILSDFNDFKFNFELVVTNYENLHKTIGEFDLVILDEASCCSAFPKPSVRTKLIKQRFSKCKMILLSGTPASESYSQWYHQFWISENSPFKNYTNFYKWAKGFTIPSLIYTSYGTANDYSKAKINEINEIINPYIHKYTQQNAGFENVIEKHLHFIKMNTTTYKLINQLKIDKFVKGKTEMIMGDTVVSLMSKQHQLGSGTIKFQSGSSATLDNTKAIFIKENIKGKLAILYYFKEELNMLLETFGDNCTTDLNEFNNTGKHFIGQQTSCAMGVNLSKADCLVYLNFGFSGAMFLQSLERLTIKERLTTDVHFVLAENTLDYSILQTIEKKKNFTKKMYEQIK